MESLPSELINMEIIKYLDEKSIINLTRTSKCLYDILQEQRLELKRKKDIKIDEMVEQQRLWCYINHDVIHRRKGYNHLLNDLIKLMIANNDGKPTVFPI